MGERTKYPTILVVVAIFLLVGACASGFIIGHLTSGGSNEAASNTSGSKDTDALFAPFWEAWQLVHDYYLEQPVDEQKMMQPDEVAKELIRGIKNKKKTDPMCNDKL